MTVLEIIGSVVLTILFASFFIQAGYETRKQASYGVDAWEDEGYKP